MIVDQTARQRLIQRNQDRKMEQVVNSLKKPITEAINPIIRIQQNSDTQTKALQEMWKELGKLSLSGLNTGNDKINTQDKAMALLIKRMDYQLLMTYQIYKALAKKQKA